MDIRDILLLVPGAPGPEVSAALELAEQHEAKIVALHVIEPAAAPGPLETSTASHYLREHKMACLGVAETARKIIEASAERVGKRIEWRLVDGDTVRQVACHGHACDIVVTGAAAGRGDRPFDAALAERVVMQSGKPVLVIPDSYCGAAIGSSVVIAWNGTRESARAVTDSMPLLRKAQHVALLTVDAKQLPNVQGPAPGEDICAHLARHGVQAQAQAIASEGKSAGQAIVAWAQAQQADLLAMGAFGHWRVRELLLGGATRDVLREARVPVLMSH